MKENDRFSLVSYSNDVKVDIPLRYMTKEKKKLAKTAIKALKDGGCTALCDGLVRGTHHTTESYFMSVFVLFSRLVYTSCPACACTCGNVA